MRNKLFYMGKNRFSKQTIPQMRCEIHSFQLCTRECVSINYFQPYHVEVEGQGSVIQYELLCNDNL